MCTEFKNRLFWLGSGLVWQMESALSLLMWRSVLFLFPKEPWLLSWHADLVDCVLLSNFLYWNVLSLTVLTLWVATRFLQWTFSDCLQPLYSGAPRAKRSCGAPWVNKSTHPRKFGNHVTDRPTDRPSAPQAYQCLLSHFLATLGAQEKADCTSMLSSIDSCQNRVSADQYHLTVSRAQVSTHRGYVFFLI